MGDNMTKNEKRLYLLLENPFGNMIMMAMCFFLFIALFGIGYLAIGIFLFYMIEKSKEKKGIKSGGGSGGLGVVIIWPVVFIMYMLGVGE